MMERCVSRLEMGKRIKSRACGYRNSLGATVAALPAQTLDHGPCASSSTRRTLFQDLRLISTLSLFHSFSHSSVYRL